ncbi:YdcH family protein (plasmid) [Photobacterium sp. DA100]|uniref:YdcH family protein n=1 Tax=Photobacterium sp. DA100 TaxID=3027472 RepID=UPI002478FAE3|nr:YdcH family protein [Photobacterium sp. DA100]WEM45093.1 YdcH family protein [Photobacterium sp. DA100]
MLGEDHSLLSEFPQFKDTIFNLSANNDVFAKDAIKYDSLDKEIRELELSGSPIDDVAMHQLKHQRAELKDSLHQRLLSGN